MERFKTIQQVSVFLTTSIPYEMWNIINPATVSEFLWPNLALFLPNEQRLLVF